MVLFLLLDMDFIALPNNFIEISHSLNLELGFGKGKVPRVNHDITHQPSPDYSSSAWGEERRRQNVYIRDWTTAASSLVFILLIVPRQKDVVQRCVCWLGGFRAQNSS